MFFLTCFSECVLTDSRSLVFTRCASSLSLNWATPRWVWSLPSGYFYWQVIPAGNLSHVTEYCWIFSCVLSMQHICFLVLFPFLFNFLRKLKLFLWVRRNQSCIQLKYLPKLSTAAMWTGWKADVLLCNLVKIACRLALCCERNAVF